MIQLKELYRISAMTSELRRRQLENIYRSTLWVIKEFFNRMKLHDIALFVIGSFAKRELSCIKEKEFLVVSDLDLYAFTSLATYFKCILLKCDEYVKNLEKVFLAKGIKLHINLPILPFWLYRIGLFRLNTIDQYEMARIICSEVRKICDIYRVMHKHLDVDNYDILNLVISSFADYLSVIISSKMEDAIGIYILSKRILTLLYCIELYVGLKPQSFSETPVLASMNIEKLARFIDESDLGLLKTLSRFKNTDRCLSTEELQLVNRNNLLQLYVKLLVRFLINFSNDLHIDNISNLASNISSKYRISPVKIFLLILLYTGLYVLNKLVLAHEDADRVKEELVVIARYRMGLRDLLRLITLKYAIILLNNRCLIFEHEEFAKVGMELIDMWHKYM